MKTIVIAALSLFITTPALAARSGNYYDSYDSRDSYRSSRPTKMYLGVSGGQAKTDLTGVTNTSTAYSVFAGYSFNEYIGAELAYTNFGDLDLDGTGVNMLKSNAGSLSFVATLPMGKHASLFVKGGYASTTTELTSSGVAFPTESTGGGTYGAGIQFNAGRRMGIRLAYDSYNMLLSTVNYKTNVASLGLMFKF